MDFDPAEVARQLCLVEQNLYRYFRKLRRICAFSLTSRQIHPKECLKHVWNKKPEQAVNVTRVIDNFNTVSSWVSTLILQTQDIKCVFI